MLSSFISSLSVLGLGLHLHVDGDLLLDASLPLLICHLLIALVLTAVVGLRQRGDVHLLIRVDNTCHLVLDLVATLDLGGLLGVGTDLLMDFGVEGLKSLDLVGFEALDPAAELLFVLGSVRFLELVHVDLDVRAEDLVSVLLATIGLVGVLSLLLFPLLVGTGVPPGGMRDVKTSIAGALQAPEDPRSGRGPGEPDIEHGHEGPALLEVLIGLPVLSGGLFESLVQLVHAELLQESPREKKPGAIGGWVVSQTSGEPEFLELGGLGLGEDDIALVRGVDHLADDLRVGDPRDEPVLLGIIFIVVLNEQALSLLVVSFSLATPAVLGLVAPVICLVLNYFHEHLGKLMKEAKVVTI